MVVVFLLAANGNILTPNRVAAAANPQVSVGLASEVMLGENFSFNVTFDNGGSNSGFGPFIDLVFPFAGADGVYPFASGFEADGVNFTGATFLGTTVKSTVQQFTTDNAGCVNHPYAIDNAGIPITVCGTPGDKLVTLQLPFGSFVVGQPNVVVNVNAELSNWADVNQALNIKARGGFQYGQTALNDYTSDPSILGSFADNNTTPTIMSLSKTYSGPEAETASGPSFPRTYTVRANVANGQTVSSFILRDNLPNNIAYTSFGSASPGGSSISDIPSIGTAANNPNSNLDVTWPSITGSSGTNDATMSFNFFVPQLDANGTPVIPTTGGCVQSINDAYAEGSWTPIDPRDSAATVVSNISNNDFNLKVCSTVIRKSVAIVTDSGPTGATPGDILEYTLTTDVSDFFALDNVNIADVLSDGQHFYPAFNPTLTLTMKGTNTSGNIDSANYQVVDHFTGGSPAVAPIDGTQAINFNISNELISRNFGTAGRVIGGCVPVAGGTIDCSGSSATTYSVKFRAQIQQAFTDNYLPQNANVDQGDRLNNTVTVSSTVLNNADLSSTGNIISDNSSAGVTIINGILASKTIYAINGVVGSYANPKIGPGDTVTYSIRFNLPSSDIETLVITDYFPLPVFNATQVTSFTNAAPSAAVPAAGVAKFGPNDTFYTLSGILPILSTNAGSNTVVFDYGSYQTTNEQATTIEILVTVAASNQPYADGLFLTNQAQSSQGTTNSSITTATQIVQVELTLPNLKMTKGVVASDSPAEVYTPTLRGPVTFSNPPATGSCPRYSGTINSTNLTSSPINSDVAGLDAGDLVTFAVSIENTGQGVNGAYDISVRDVIPSGYSIPVSGLNLCVTDGAGVAMAYSAINGGDTNPLLENGILLTDSPTAGALAKHDASNGKNIAIITYNLQLNNSVEPNSPLTNTARLMSYASSEGGPDFATQDIVDTAITTTKNVTLNKTIAATNVATTTGNNVAIGEIVSYQVVITVPEGTTSNAQLLDTLDSGLAIVAIDSVTPSVGLTTSQVGGFPGVISAATYGPNGISTTLPFGTITNSDVNNTNSETITIDYRAVVVNQSGIARGTTLNNNANFTWSGANSVVASAVNVTIIEPTLRVVKTVNPTTADIGDTVAVTMVVSHAAASNSHAYEAVLTDILPTGMTFAGGLTNSAGLATTTLSESSGTITATWDTFNTGQTSTITFNVTINNTVAIGQAIVNTGSVRWSSLAGSVLTAQSTHNANSTERTGDTANPGGAANNYTASGSATETVFVPNPVKTIAATSETNTVAISGIERVAVGEIVRYRMVVRLAEANANNLQLVDSLSTGLQFLNDNTAKVAFVSNSTGITSSTLDPVAINCNGGANPSINLTGNETTLSSLVPACPLPGSAISTSATLDSDTYTDGTDPRFKLGNLLNSDNDTDQEFLIVEFNALVLNVASSQSSVQRNNTFTVNTGGTTLIATSAQANSNRIIVAEPVVTIAKAITTAPIDAGDPISYTLTVTNTASGNDGSDAFDIIISDSLNSKLTYGSVNVSTPNSYTDNTSGNNVSITLNRLNKGQTATITINATVNNNLGPGEQITNNATLSYSSLPGSGTPSNSTGSVAGTAGSSTGERIGTSGVNDYLASSSTVTSTLVGASIEKLAPSPTNYTVGQTVDYYLVITLPEGVVNNLHIIDALPEGLRYASSSMITTATPGVISTNFNGTLPTNTVSGGANDGDDVSINFTSATVTSDNDATNNTFAVRVSAVVTNILTNQRGSSLTNSASMTFTDPNNGSNTITVNAPTSRSITINEPILTISKQAVVIPSPVQAGSVVTYRLVIAHHANSNADAQQVVISDPINSGLGTISNVQISTTGSVAAPSFSTAGNNLTVPTSGGFTLPDDGSTVTVDYDVTIAAGASENITNSANVVWQSTTVTNPNTRGSANGPYDISETGATGINDYRVQAIDNSVSTDSPSISKLLVNSSAAHTSNTTDPAQVTIGETATFILKVNLPEGNTSSLSVTDSLASNWEYVSHQLVTTAASSHGTLTDNFNGTLSGPTCSTCVSGAVGPSLVFDFSNVNVAADNDGTNNFIAIELVARVRNNPINHGFSPTQTTFANTATVQANLPTGSVANSATVNFIVVEPNVTISKEFDSGVDPDRASPNQTVQVNINIGNNGTTAAQDLAWSDNLDSTMNYQANTLAITCDSGVIASVSDSAAPNLTGTISELPVGDSCQISFAVRIPANLNAITYPTITNQTQVGFSSLTGSTAGERSYGPFTSSDSLTVQVPNLRITKSDGLTTILPGNTAVYNLTIANIGSAPASGIEVSETVPEHTVFQPADSTSGWSCSPDNNPGSSCTFNLSSHLGSSLAAGANSSINFAVRVDRPLILAISSISNSASVLHDNTNGIDPDLSDNSATDTDQITAYVDLAIDKIAPATIGYNQDINYTLNYQNNGNATANGVVISETVPTNSTFQPAASTSGWSCVPNNNAGSSCSLNVGSLASTQTGTASFTVKTNTYPPIFTSISNSATISDNGASGADFNPADNTDSTNTVIEFSNVFDPPTGLKTVTETGDVILTWRMVWINSGNVTAYRVRITDPVPANSTYVNGSFSCDPRGASTTVSCFFDSINNQVVWEGNIAPDLGGSTEDDSINEVVLAFDVKLDAGITQSQNQASANWDDNGDGSVDDDILVGQVPAITNDPMTSPNLDPTAWTAAILPQTSGYEPLPIMVAVVMLLAVVIIQIDVSKLNLSLAMPESVKLPTKSSPADKKSTKKSRIKLESMSINGSRRL
jgi:fimbrial isopeptide formation D2 family protein/uncharacterized repeat protein (TIGR01451 family)